MTAKRRHSAKRRRGSDIPEIVARMLAEHDGAHGAIMAVLADVQSEYGYLPEEALRAVADQTGRSLVDIYGVATFYRSFSLKPRGKHVISVCVGTACHVRGARMIVEELERRLGIKAGETTPDGECSLEAVNCLGACALGPIVVVDGRYFSNVDTAKVKGILKDIRPKLARAQKPAEAVPAK